MAGFDEGLLFSERHCWVRGEGEDGVVRVGITAHAQQELGDVVYVDPPIVHRSYVADERCATIESVKTASDVHNPLTGRVLEANPALESEPDLLNRSPYDKGWLYLMRVDNIYDMRHLLSAEDYDNLLKL